jgi:hypothetical protein
VVLLVIAGGIYWVWAKDESTKQAPTETMVENQPEPAGREKVVPVPIPPAPAQPQEVVLNLNDASNTRGDAFKILPCTVTVACPRSWHYLDGNTSLTLRFFPGIYPPEDYTLDYFKQKLDVASLTIFALPGFSVGDFDVRVDPPESEKDKVVLTSFGQDRILRGRIELPITQLNYVNRRLECVGPADGGGFTPPSYCEKASVSTNLLLKVNFSIAIPPNQNQ